MNYLPKLLKSDFDEYKRRERELYLRCERGEFSEGMLQILTGWLKDWLRERMAPEDEIIFPDINGLRGFLLSMGLPFEQMYLLSQHELEHGEMAQDLGYDVSYGIYLMMGEDGKEGAMPFCRFRGNITPSDWRAIHGAASEPGVYDKLSIS